MTTPSPPPGYSPEAHPEVFNISAMPKPSSTKKIGQLPEETIRQFFEKGYIIVPDFFRDDELAPCKTSIDELVDDFAQRLYRAGKIKDLYSEYGFKDRLTYIENDFYGANMILHKNSRPTKAFKDLWANERLLNVVEQLLGPDVAGHPLWTFRTKTPRNDATVVPWHQDLGYLDNSAYSSLIITAWIPLIDATEENGCLQIAERGHKTGRVGKHKCCHDDTSYVMLEEEEMESALEIDLKTDIKTCEVPYGGVMFFSNIIPHQSLPNTSDQIRWSFDLRWQKPGEPNGFYGLKEGVLMRTAEDPNFKVDWTEFDKSGRHDLLREAVNATEEEEFDSTIQGPWMKKWEVIHMNRHVSSFLKKEKEDSTKSS